LHICQLIAILEKNPAVMIEIDLEKENKAIAREYKELLRISYQTLLRIKKTNCKAFDVAVDA
jgi:GTP pyrophosphokinase